LESPAYATLAKPDFEGEDDTGEYERICGHDRRASQRDPYHNQHAIPMQNAPYDTSEIACVSRVRTTRTTCGTKDAVVIVAAIYPTISVRATT